MLRRGCRRLTLKRVAGAGERKSGRFTSAPPAAMGRSESPDVHICLRLATDTFAATRPLSHFRGTRPRTFLRHRSAALGGSGAPPGTLRLAGARDPIGATRPHLPAWSAPEVQLIRDRNIMFLTYPLGIQHEYCSCAAQLSHKRYERERVAPHARESRTTRLGLCATSPAAARPRVRKR